MSETQEEVKQHPFASMFGNESAAEKPEEPKEDSPAAETAEETPDKPKEDKPAKPEEEKAESKEGEEVKTEDDEPEVDEQGRIVVKFDDDEEADAKQAEDVESLRAQVKALLEEKEKAVVPKLDPRIAKLNEYVQGGGEINAAVWELQSKDYSNINVKDSKDALTVIKDKLKYIEGYDDKEVNFLLKKKYPITAGFEEDPDEDDKQSEEMSLRMDAKSSLDPLKEFQNKVLLPDVDHNKAAETEKAVNLYRAESSAKLDEIEAFDLELDADTKLKIPFSGQARNFARSIITDPNKMNTFWNDRYTKEDGSVDYNRFAKELHFLESMPRLFNAVFAQGQSKGKKAILEEIQGENATPKLKQPSGNPTKKTGLAAITFD